MGARVHVIVTSVNPIEGLMDLALVEVEQGAGAETAEVAAQPQAAAHAADQAKVAGER